MPPSPAPERCPVCDRAECEMPCAAARRLDVGGGPLEVVLDAEARLARAARDCAAHAVDWRAVAYEAARWIASEHDDDTRKYLDFVKENVHGKR
jgi:hypothetical protein